MGPEEEVGMKAELIPGLRSFAEESGLDAASFSAIGVFVLRWKSSWWSLRDTSGAGGTKRWASP